VTIVDISELDTFVRDSLFNVRKGIANSRNATQSNPLLGVMVDLPDKIDFEIFVTSAYQSLNRISSSLESRNDRDNVTSQNNTGNLSSDVERSSSSEQASDFSQGSGNEGDKRSGSGTEEDIKQGNETTTDTRSGIGTETGTKNGNGSETDSKSDNGSEVGTKNGSGSETDTKGGSGTETDTKNGGGTETENKEGSRIELDTKKGSASENEDKKGIGKKNDTRYSRQLELHKEANDRASWSFDEEDGTWGFQGQISTPTLRGGPSCQC